MSRPLKFRLANRPEIKLTKVKINIIKPRSHKKRGPTVRWNINYELLENYKKKKSQSSTLQEVGQTPKEQR